MVAGTHLHSNVCGALSLPLNFVRVLHCNLCLSVETNRCSVQSCREGVEGKLPKGLKAQGASYCPMREGLGAS